MATIKGFPTPYWGYDLELGMSLVSPRSKAFPTPYWGYDLERP